MRQIFILCCLFITLSLQAQQHRSKAISFPFLKRQTSSKSLGSAAACDTVNFTKAKNWQPSIYFVKGKDKGYVFGTSDNAGFRVLEDLNYFDISSSANAYITGGLVYFGHANSTEDANLTKTVNFNVYANDGGLPGALLGATSLTLEQIHENAVNNLLTEFKFSQPILLPVSKQFYVSVEHSNFNWTSNVHDSIALVSSKNGVTTAASYQKIETVNQGTYWIPANHLWDDENGDSLDVNLFIFPYVNNEAEGCVTLPVSIFNFGANIKNGQAYLNWSTATEINNKGFYVERSKNGKDFTNVGFVKGAGNSNKIEHYTYTDASLKNINVSKTYYRLKQVDVDGKSSYSKVISLSLTTEVSAGEWKLYPNPVKDFVTIQLNSEVPAKVKVQLISQDGKTLLNADKGLLNQGIEQFYLNTQNLAQGSYILRVTINNRTSSGILVKE